MDPITLFSVVCGAEYLAMFERIAIRSLLQSGNLPQVLDGGNDVRWHIYCKAEERDAVAAIQGRCLQGYAVEIRPMSNAETAYHCLLKTAAECHAEGRRFLLAPPDLFWGNGSISNMTRYAEGRAFTVASANIRVLDTKFTAALDSWTAGHAGVEISNAQLVGLTMATLHECAEEMFDDLDANATFNGSLSLRRIGSGLYTLIHHLHSPWLCWFTDVDIAYWKAIGNFGVYDHAWPTLLVEQDRLRIVGSSDLVWNAEMTQAGGHYAPKIPGMMGNDRTHAIDPHNLANGRVVMTLRAEPLT